MDESDSGDGTHYIMSGTWLRDRRPIGKDLGVVSDITELHESGTVVIHWYPNSTEFISAPMFRERCMSGRWEIDDGGGRTP